jgi:hypothetical protein
VPAEEGAPAAAADTPVSPDPRPVGKPSPQSGAASLGKAYLHHLSGPLRGETKLVDKSLYTIGQPGGTLAVISRRAKGYVLLHLGGDDLTTLNGQAVLGAGVALNQGDMIQVGDRRMEFRLEG